MRTILARLAVFIATDIAGTGPNNEQDALGAAVQRERLAKRIGYAALLGYFVAISSVISIVIVVVRELQLLIRPLTEMLTIF